MRETISKQVLSVLLDANRVKPVIVRDHCANNLLNFITRFAADPATKAAPRSGTA
jgi:hypothetical protein